MQTGIAFSLALAYFVGVNDVMSVDWFTTIVLSPFLFLPGDIDHPSSPTPRCISCGFSRAVSFTNLK